MQWAITYLMALLKTVIILYIFFSTDRPGGPGGHNRNYGNNAPDNNLGLAAQLLAKPEALTTALTTLASLSSLGNLGGGLLAGLAGSGSGTGGSGHVTGRALPDITSVPEVRQNLKIRTVRKPDVFLPGRRTFNTFENRKKLKKKYIFFFKF